MVNKANETDPEHGVTRPALFEPETELPEETETTSPASVIDVVAANSSLHVLGVQLEDTHPLMPAPAWDS